MEARGGIQFLMVNGEFLILIVLSVTTDPEAYGPEDAPSCERFSFFSYTA